MTASKVYFIEDDRGMVKIGYSTDPLSRIMDLQVAHHGRLSFVRLIDGGPKTEAWLHRRFADHRVAGEWFRLHPDMLSVVPPDEVPVVEKVKPKLRMTLREGLIFQDRLNLFEGRDDLLAASLLGYFWEDDLHDLIKWIRQRTRVAEPARLPADEVAS